MTFKSLSFIINISSIFFREGGIKIKEDARIVKTKARLVSTFKELLGEKKFENITINEICDRAEIRRATFYKHFQDKYDFLGFFIRSLRENFDMVGKYGKPDATAGYYIEYAQEIINFLDENDEIIRNILESDIVGTIISVIIVENLKQTKERLNMSVQKGMRLPASVNTVADILVGGVATLALNWFSKGRPIPKEQLLGEIASVITLIGG